jgi:nucleoside-diphosphate-sugar epimerase
METVLITGASGYIAQHIILQLLAEGYQVRGTLRNMTRSAEVLENLTRGGATAKQLESISFVPADLTADAGWFEAVENVDYVIHTASPTPATRPKSDEEFVEMAVSGVRRVMEAILKAGHVKRFVLTSASGAVLGGQKEQRIFDENDWTQLNADIDPYQRSKTLQEKFAWDFADEYGIEMSAVLPVAVQGPVLGQDFSHSQRIVKQMMTNQLPFTLNLGFDVVDVRDVAQLHLLALAHPEAAGERFLATSGENLTFKQQNQMLAAAFPGRKIHTRVLPDALVRVLASFNASYRMPASFLGQKTGTSSAKAHRLLGWTPRGAEEALVATAQSMVELGII